MSGSMALPRVRTFLSHTLCVLTHEFVGAFSSIRRWDLEDPRRTPRPVSVQVTQYRFHEQDLSPQHR